MIAAAWVARPVVSLAWFAGAAVRAGSDAHQSVTWIDPGINRELA
jgi:hypothetical protein